MSRYRQTPQGKERIRRHQARFYRRSQLAVEWIKANRPDIWKMISDQAEAEVASQKNIGYRVKKGKK